MVKQQTQNIKVIALGGAGEIGKNMYVIEVDEDIFVLDAGLMFPETEMLGIDVVIPDISYLIENKERVQGIFLSHGHEDHIGALPYIIEDLDAPVYGTRLTIELAKAKIEEIKGRVDVEFEVVDSNTALRFASSRITFFKTNHSIPDSVGICIDTKEGAIVYTGDFKFDQAAQGHYKAEVGKMAAIGDAGVLCLLSDSSGAEKVGFTPSESLVAAQMSDEFYKAKGRIIVACYASNVNGLQQVFNAAHDNQKKVAVVGKSMQKVLDIALNFNYLKLADETLIPVDQLENYNDDEVVILAAGQQGEPFEVLQKMAKHAHKQVNIKQGDTVLLAANPLYGGELLMSRTIDLLFRAGAMVVAGKNRIHVSGHGSQEELKMMLNLMRPKYFIPIQGDYKMLIAHMRIAKSIGFKQEQILIPENGEVISISKEQIESSGKVTSGNVLIDGIGVGDVGNIVLRDRRLLSQDGILIVVVTLSRSDKSIVAGPEIISRGFVYVRESESLMEKSNTIVREIVLKNTSKDHFDWAGMKQEIRDNLHSFLFEKTKRRPMILPIIMEV
ncbi:Zn-dependent hydrolase [Pradoshia eiseniae]|uniref:Ribonuclease J n=1 Tax=Pradoshia eiseniae TaxID=2064768 RepID=A0A2S7N1F1_9BACI|nr:ribonuclease J [Pradoshia eiseniae]PQD95818.1 Zn-dependent hydrolase [Pradoshia eiseniae]